VDTLSERKILNLGLSMAMAVILMLALACSSDSEPETVSVKLALDWYPNSNHLGLKKAISQTRISK